MHFQRSKNLKENFQTTLDKIFVNFYVSAQFALTTNETKLEYYNQKVKKGIASRVAERLKT